MWIMVDRQEWREGGQLGSDAVFRRGDVEFALGMVTLDMKKIKQGYIF